MTPDPVSTFASLGVAGLICVVLMIVWRQAESKLIKAEAEIRELNRLRLEDRDKFLPLASDMVRVLGGATVAIEQRGRPDAHRLEQQLDGIEEALALIRRGQDR